MQRTRTTLTVLAVAASALLLQGCVAVSLGMAAGTVVGAAANLAVGTTKVAVKTTAGTVRTVGRAVTPGDGRKRRDRDEERYADRR